jgi:hypothetical protein
MAARIVVVEDQNFRVNVDTGEVTVDGTLAYATGDAQHSFKVGVFCSLGRWY